MGVSIHSLLSYHPDNWRRYCYRIIRNFGNYDEIYRRHLWAPLGLDVLQAQYPDESEAQLTPEQVEQFTQEQKLARADLNGRIGPNRSWRRGGNLIAPPF